MVRLGSLMIVCKRRYLTFHFLPLFSGQLAFSAELFRSENSGITSFGINNKNSSSSTFATKFTRLATVLQRDRNGYFSEGLSVFSPIFLTARRLVYQYPRLGCR